MISRKIEFKDFDRQNIFRATQIGEIFKIEKIRNIV